MGGRFIDLFRGTSAEASLPVAGSRESAAGDALYQLLVALVVTGGLFPIVLSGLLRGFGVVGLGAFVPSEAATLHVVTLAGGAMATGLAVGAPVAGAVLAVDCLMGMASRAAPQVNLQELGAPLRILGGGALLWLGVGVICERLLAGVMGLEGALLLLAELAR
jgi:flagellar biosynthesis protein FliR